MREIVIRKKRFGVATAQVAALAACIALGALGADPVTAALDCKLLPSGNRIVYDNMLKAVYEADLAADEAWTACKTSAELAAHQRKVRAALVEALSRSGASSTSPVRGAWRATATRGRNSTSRASPATT